MRGESKGPAAFSPGLPKSRDLREKFSKSVTSSTCRLIEDLGIGDDVQSATILSQSRELRRSCSSLETMLFAASANAVLSP